jgi:hypothetical protein
MPGVTIKDSSEEDGASQADDLRSVTLRWLQVQEEEMGRLSGSQAVASYDTLPGWLHGKFWSSTHKATVVCAPDQASAAQYAGDQVLSTTFLAFPVLKTMAMAQWEMSPADFSIAEEDLGESGDIPITKKRLPPAAVQMALENLVEELFVRFSLLIEVHSCDLSTVVEMNACMFLKRSVLQP